MTECNADGYFYGFLGSALALSLAAAGSGYGIAKSGLGVFEAGRKSPETLIKSTVPAIMASIVSIYGLIISIVLTTKVNPVYSMYGGYSAFNAGLAVGISGIAAGVSIGIVGDIGVRDSVIQPKIYGAMILILIFGEALGLYGLIVGLIMSTKDSTSDCVAPLW